MKIQNFPWSPALAGFGSGVAGFVLAALAAGSVHVGPGDSCRVADRRDGAGGHRFAALARDAPAADPCRCCCDGPRVLTSDCQDEPLQLAAIEPCSTTAATGGEVAPPVVRSPPTAAADSDPAVDAPPIAPPLERTGALVADPIGEFLATPPPLAGRPGPADPAVASIAGSSFAPLAASSAGGGGFGAGGGGFGGGGGARPDADLGVAPTSAAAGSLAAVVLAWDRADLAGTASWLADLASGEYGAAAGSAPSGETAPAVLGVTLGDGRSGDVAGAGIAGADPGPGPGPGGATTSGGSPVMAVPEPASLVLTLVGVGLAGGVARRRSVGRRSGPRGAA